MKTSSDISWRKLRMTRSARCSAQLLRVRSALLSAHHVLSRKGMNVTEDAKGIRFRRTTKTERSWLSMSSNGKVFVQEQGQETVVTVQTSLAWPALMSAFFAGVFFLLTHRLTALPIIVGFLAVHVILMGIGMHATLDEIVSLAEQVEQEARGRR